MTFRGKELSHISGTEKELLFLEHNEQGWGLVRQRSCRLFECMFRILEPDTEGC